MAYKETAKSVTRYGEDQVGDWKLNYKYETTGDEKPVNIQVNGDNGKGGNLNGNLTAQNKGVYFGGGADYDIDVVKSIFDTYAKLTK